jgi:hypothetical protein
MGFEKYGAKHEPVLSPPLTFHHQSPQHELAYGTAYAASHGGLLPQDTWWTYVEYRYDLAKFEGESARFAHFHPKMVGLLNRDATVRAEQEAANPYMTNLPNTPDWRYLEYRYALDPTRFAHNHAPSLVALLKNDLAYRDTHSFPTNTSDRASVISPSIIAQDVVPEPASFLLLTLGLLGGLLFGICTRKGNRAAVKVA